MSTEQPMSVIVQMCVKKLISCTLNRQEDCFRSFRSSRWKRSNANSDEAWWADNVLTGGRDRRQQFLLTYLLSYLFIYLLIYSNSESSIVNLVSWNSADVNTCRSRQRQACVCWDHLQFCSEVFRFIKCSWSDRFKAVTVLNTAVIWQCVARERKCLIRQ